MQQLNDLKDIHLPVPISWWPLATGWWLSFSLIIILLCAYYITKKIRQKQRLKKQIKAELKAIETYYIKTKNKALLAKSLSALLRRASISYYPQQHIAGLTNNHWLIWLDNTLKNTQKKQITKQNSFLSETGKILLNAPYLPKNAKLNYNAEQLILLCNTWLLANHNKNKGGIK